MALTVPTWRMAILPALVALIVLAPTRRGAAESMSQALASAYLTSPEIEAERARTRAADEGVARSQAGYRPQVRAEAFAGRRKVDTTLTDDAAASSGLLGTAATQSGIVDPRGVQLSVEQTLFDGFRTASAVGRSEAEVGAAQQKLRSIEARVLLQAATAYLDVFRDQRIVSLRETSLSLLKEEGRSVEQRLKSSDATNAERAQVRARIAGAQSELEIARANVIAARATYTQIVGHDAVHLVGPRKVEGLLPRSLNEALAGAQTDNPDVAAALYLEEANRHAVTQARADLLPKATLAGTWQAADDPTPGVKSSTEAALVARLSVPLYEGGAVYASVRQAKHEQVARMEDVRAAASQTVRLVTSAWARLNAARAAALADKERHAAAQEAYQGFKREMEAGTRTLIDVLNAQRESAEAEVALASSEHDEIVGGYELLAATGRLSAATLSLTPEIYDPDIHLKEVRNKWIGTSIAGEEASAPVRPERVIPAPPPAPSSPVRLRHAIIESGPLHPVPQPTPAIALRAETRVATPLRPAME